MLKKSFLSLILVFTIFYSKVAFASEASKIILLNHQDSSSQENNNVITLEDQKAKPESNLETPILISAQPQEKKSFDRIDQNETSNFKSNTEFKIPKEFIFFPDKGDENSSLIVRINLGRFIILSEGMVAYKINDTIFLPLGEFVKAAEFPININEDLSGANGWFIEEKKLFIFNFREKILLSKGVRFEVNRDQIKVIDNEIFFDIALLQKVFPLKLSFDPYEQTIEVTSLEPLPIETSLERDKRWEEFRQEDSLRKSSEAEDNKMKPIKIPYKALSSPIIDMRYNNGYKRSKTEGDVKNSDFNALIGADALYLNHQLFFSTNNSKLTNARLTSGRKDSQGELLGPLKATEFLFGDVIAPQNFLISRGGQLGKGATVTNYPEEYVSGFDRVLVRGNMQAGWDVELYRNDQLLYFEKVGANGIYEFQNVPLVSGANVIRLIFYGPFGQKREEIRKFFTSDNLLKKDKFYYRFAVNKNNENLIKLSESQISPKDPRNGVNRYFSEIAYGVNKTTSLIADFIKIPIENNGKSHSYASSAIRSSAFGVYSEFNIARNIEDKSNAIQTSFQTKVGEQSVTLKNIRYDTNFVSEQHQESLDPLIDSYTIRLDGPLGEPSKNIINSINLTQEAFKSKNKRLDIQDDISSMIGSKLSLGQNLRYISDSRISDDQKITKTGRTIVNYRISRPITFRTSISYDFTPSLKMNSTSSNIDYSFENNAILNFGHNFHFPQAGKSGATNYIASISKPFKSIITSMSGSYNDDDKSYGVNLNLSMSVGYDLRYRTGVISGTPLANSGIISARIFLDKNNNGIFDNDESGLEGIRMIINNSISNNKSDKKGFLINGQVATNDLVKIKLNIDDINDPRMISKKSAFKIFIHSGSITNLDFPIILTGEIDGVVKIKNKGSQQQAASVKLELIDEKGNLVKETVSAYDGYYIFDMVPYGDYKVRISTEQMKRLGFKSESDHSVKVDEDNQESQLNFSIWKEEAEEVESKTSDDQIKNNDLEKNDDLKNNSYLNLTTKKSDFSGNKKHKLKAKKSLKNKKLNRRNLISFNQKNSKISKSKRSFNKHKQSSKKKVKKR